MSLHVVQYIHRKQEGLEGAFTSNTEELQVLLYHNFGELFQKYRPQISNRVTQMGQELNYEYCVFKGLQNTIYSTVHYILNFITV